MITAIATNSFMLLKQPSGNKWTQKMLIQFFNLTLFETNCHVTVTNWFLLTQSMKFNK